MKRPTRREFLHAASVGLAALGAKSGVSAQGIRPGQAPGGSRLTLRGLTVDAARVPEKPAYYRRLIDFCHDWELNALLFRLTDDQGSMLRFRSHPDLITHAHALAPEEAHDLARYGESRGVTVIPEVESFGHSRYITMAPKYAHLADRQPGGRGEFAGLIPVDPETVALIGDLYKEVAGIFPSPYLHGGCDEVNWGGAELSRRALQTRSRAQIWAEYLNSLDEVCRGLGKELIVWGDFVLHKEPDILPRLSKRVIVMDWQYYITEAAPLAQAAREVIDRGLRVIGAPAIISCEWGPRAGDLQLRNIDAYADAYSSVHDARSLGVIVTNWIPSRYLQRSLWDTFAYAAVCLNRGSDTAQGSAFHEFVDRFYGSSWSHSWQDVFKNYYAITPNRHSCAPHWPGPRLPVPWASEDDLRRAAHAPPVETPPFKQLRSHVAAVAATVRSNQPDFSAFALSAEYLDYLYWRDDAVRARASSARARSAGEVILKIADRDRSLVDRLEAEWDTGRFADSQARVAPVIDFRAPDQLLFRMHAAKEFSAGLASDGDRFLRLIA